MFYYIINYNYIQTINALQNWPLICPKYQSNRHVHISNKKNGRIENKKHLTPIPSWPQHHRILHPSLFIWFHESVQEVLRLGWGRVPNVVEVVGWKNYVPETLGNPSVRYEAEDSLDSKASCPMLLPGVHWYEVFQFDVPEVVLPFPFAFGEAPWPKVTKSF